MTARKHSDEEQARRQSTAGDKRGGQAPPAGAGAAGSAPSGTTDAAATESAPAGTATDAAFVAEAVADAAGTVDPIIRLMAERDEYLDHLQRLTAEFDNYRKRVRRDTEELRLRAAEGVVESLLPIMDNMQRALQAAEHHEEGQLIAGVELVAGQLRSVLASHGLEQVETEVGTPFDPTVHEAVLTQSSDEFDEGCIARVLEPGYLLHGRLLRAARVVVVK
ncbi:MAG: nucleotide exchange factor GrpE [Thermoleophilia bacterium]